MFSSGFFVIHDTTTSSHNDITAIKPEVHQHRAKNYTNEEEITLKGHYPNCLEGNKLFVHFSICVMGKSNLGDITPHLLIRPVKLTTTFPAL